MASYNLDPRGPLAAQEIRLLEIYPSTVAKHALQCRLFRANLDGTQMRPYEALSYVWGDDTMRADLRCNRKTVSVTLNLFDALKRLRLPEKSRFIWADAICIDQGSASEKSRQIPLMGKIFSSAERVVVWLGKCDFAQAEGALKSVELIADQLRKVKEKGGSDSISWKTYNALQVPSEYTGESTKEFLRRLYTRPWFSRVWCVQEIVLARDAVMFWGDFELSWTTVGEITLWLSAIQPTRALAFEEDAFYADMECVNAEYMYGVQRKRLGLLESLDQVRPFQATDPRDRVYGILALIEPAEDAGALSVDYNKDIGEVYADVVVADIRSCSALDVLAFVDHGDEYISDGTFPSWTPLWHDRCGGLRHLPHDDSDLSASRGTMVETTDASHLNTQYLRLKGYFYSRITTVHVKMGMHNMEHHETHPFKDILFTVLREHADDDRDVMRKLARTLTAGCTSDMDDNAATTKKKKDRFYESFADYVQCLFMGIDFLEFRKKRQRQETFYDEAEITCSARKFFQTNNNSFGIGPACMMEGDVVVVLFGGKTPYILRPCGRSYLCMGQAYVDELMRGELVDAMEARRVKEQEFFLV